MELVDFLKVFGLLSLFIFIPLFWVMLKREKSDDPGDVYWDYSIMEDTGKFSRSFYQALISPFIEWFKIKNEGDIKWLLTSNPIRLTIAHTLLESPLGYDLLYEKVCKKLENHFKVKVSERSYDYHFTWLMDAKIIRKIDEYYHLALLPIEVVDLVNRKFETSGKG